MRKNILLLFFGFTLTLNAQEMIIVPVPYAKQDSTNWCVAAVHNL
jgi:hypothetical protein